jgi:hypothetical protein
MEEQTAKVVMVFMTSHPEIGLLFVDCNDKSTCFVFTYFFSDAGNPFFSLKSKGA